MFNGRNLDLIDDLFNASWTYVGSGGQRLNGREEFKGFLSNYFDAFPDLKVKVEDIIAEDDKVVTMVSGRGTHKGELMGLAPTGKEINTTVICISQLEKGKIVKDWELVDLFGMLKQLGALPEPAPQK